MQCRVSLVSTVVGLLAVNLNVRIRDDVRLLSLGPGGHQEDTGENANYQFDHLQGGGCSRFW